MCTVVLHVPETPEDPVRMLAVRDEDPARPWLPLGESWPDRPGVVGVRDVRAGGAWLAADASARRLAVLLNRHSPEVPEGVTPVTRGSVALDAVAGHLVQPTSAMPGFNLVDIGPDGVRVVTWDGTELVEQRVSPGVHMIAHHDLDDHRSARIVAWHDAFADAAEAWGDGAPGWERSWLDVLARTAELDPTDARAIIRDNRPLGYPTESLLVCTAEVGRGHLDVAYAPLANPGRWNPVDLVPPVVA
ncbi:NRDE family protein [Microbacterium sp.]|uniref:NRDE family protein n=1 Tax=Microbacterium sp. TaxID=51671 RepID=UPI003A8EC61E